MLKDQIDSLAWWLTCVVAIAVKLRQEIAEFAASHFFILSPAGEVERVTYVSLKKKILKISIKHQI